MQAIADRIRSGGLGRPQLVELVFHNAYGPDKAWFYDPALSGGGCVMDLGVHLIDLALWTLGWPAVEEVRAHLFAGGAPLGDRTDVVEDLATASLTLEGGTVVTLACSWRLHAGEEAAIAARFYGTDGGAGMSNVAGSFFDFEGHWHRGTAREVLSVPPDAWGGRAAVAWAERLASDPRYDPAADRYRDTARALDRIYGR
nr:Gfo/Idh/MocA family oxidoreductase [Sphingomonas jejuensis]